MSDITLEMINPHELTIDENVRLDPRLDKAFIDSIRARGVLTPITAWRDQDGSVHVQRGQRRTLAAREAEVDTVPVAIGAEPPAEADRLIDQWVENERRAALTNGERVAAVEQMTLAGLSVTKIAKQTGTKRDTVKAALAVSKSETATEAADMLTLEQAAALAEFDDDAEAVEALIEAARRGQFDHTLSRVRNNRAEAEAIAALVEECRAAGLTVLDDEPLPYDVQAGKPTILDRLTDSDDRSAIEPEQHAANCPAHAVRVKLLSQDVYTDAEGNELTEEEVDAKLNDEYDRRTAAADDDEDVIEPDCEDLGIHATWERRPTAQAVCTEPERHQLRYPNSFGTAKKRADDMTEEEREEARIERKRVVENNAAWRAAESVRRDWLKSFATRKTAPKGAEQHIAGHVLANPDRRYNALDTLGLDSHALTSELTGCTPKRATQITLALALATWEASTDVHTWRNPDPASRDTLRALQTWGYTLSDIEAEVAQVAADDNSDEAEQ